MSEGTWLPLADVLSRVRRQEPVLGDRVYPAVSVLKEGRGLGPKEPFVGGETTYKSLFRAEVGDVVVRTITAFESPVAVVPPSFHGTYVSQVFLTYSVDRTRVDPDYLALVFQAPEFWEEMSNRAQGSVLRRKTISDVAFRSIPVWLPSLGHQQNLVGLFAHLDEYAKALISQRDAALRLRRSLFTDAVQRGCTNGPLDAVADVSQGKALPQAVQGTTSGPVPWFKIGDMTGPGNEYGYVRANTNLSLDEVLSLNGKILPRGSVVFPRVGAAVLTEKKRILDAEGAVDENHIVLTPRDGTDSEFLLALAEAIRLSDFVRPGAVPSLNLDPPSAFVRRSPSA